MAEQQKPVAPAAPVAAPKKLEFKLLGHNYVTPDLVAKVTGKARYAEDFRAEGMVFVNGELWAAQSETPVRLGESVAVAAVAGNKLIVRKI